MALSCVFVPAVELTHLKFQSDMIISTTNLEPSRFCKILWQNDLRDIEPSPGLMSMARTNKKFRLSISLF